MPFKDREDERAYQKQYHQRWYQANKDIRKQQIRDRRSIIRDWIRLLKLKCSACREDHPACLDFHHEGKKDFSISSAWQRGMSKERILIEIKKCVVMCSNCHRKLHDAHARRFHETL